MTTKKTVAKKTIRERLKDTSDVIGAVTIIGTACVGAGTWCVTQINASTNKKLDELSSQLSDIKADTTRTQLLTLINTSPDNEAEIMKVAQYYFGTLGGDWYMTSLFTKWAEEHGYTADELTFMKEATK